jgi:hypothetical protein
MYHILCRFIILFRLLSVIVTFYEDALMIDAVHTRACTGMKNGHNSVTVQNRTHVYMHFFDHKDLGNDLLQLCPKVVTPCSNQIS